MCVKTHPPLPTHIFFAGASWGCGFYIGAYRALQENYGLDTLSRCKFAGNSAGVLVALCAAAGLDWTVAERVYLKCLTEAVNAGVFQKMSVYHDHALDEVFGGDEEAYKKLNRRLFVGITCFVDEYEIISEWDSNEQLRACIHASMHIPYYCTHIEPVHVKGAVRRAVDGGFGSEIHRFNSTTLVVVALSELGDVAPEPKLDRFKDCYGPNLTKYQEMKDSGYVQMQGWDGTYKSKVYQKYAQRKRSGKEKIMVYVLWFLRMLEEVQLKRLVVLVILVVVYRRKLR